MRRFLGKPGTVDIRRFERLLPVIAARENELRDVPDEALAELAASAAGSDDGVDLAEFAAVGRECARRGLAERPHDVQLLGMLAMLSGYVAEMATGEGKTLAGALAAAGYALAGHRVHVMSVNDYLAHRDASWMRPVYELLGVTVGSLGQTSSRSERVSAYAAQVTYAAVSEFGFDVLRDRMCTDAADLIVPSPDVLLIDEADSVLVDEALVPLVLAGAAADGDADHAMAEVVRALRDGEHYEIDADARNVWLTEAGARAAEQALGGIDLYGGANLDSLTRLNVALHAHALMHRDVHYIVRDDRVQLVSESRGRVALRQRWPDGLQAAIEAKEGLRATQNGEVLDSITIESLVHRYQHACGMTGTAVAVGEELREFYTLEVAVIPTNRPCVRSDAPDRLYRSVEEKESAVAAEVASAHQNGRPVLIGTLDVSESERLSLILREADVPHTVLNAKNDAEEAAIVAEAGAYGAVTVSTQMAGRGTDIRLGGSSGDRDQVAALGGLYVIGTGRHVSSRLDDQLRGRSGRQGDPGGSVFFISMADELVTAYAPDAPESYDVEADGLVSDTKAHWVAGHAQRAAEGAHLQIHRNTWRYNQLIDHQRRLVLEHRDRVLRTDVALRTLADLCPDRYQELTEIAAEAILAEAARQIMLYHLDRTWADHLAALAELREGINLRALGQGTFVGGMDPLSEFNKEAVGLYNELIRSAEENSAETFRTVQMTAAGADLAAADLKRPTSTWTYLVPDNPFGNALDRALSGLRRRFR